MQNLQSEAVAIPDGVATAPTDRLQLALTDIAEVAKEGLLAMSVTTGLAVMHELMEEEVSRLAGPKGAHDANRAIYRHGHENGQVTLGARRVRPSHPVGLTRPAEMRGSADAEDQRNGGEVPSA